VLQAEPRCVADAAPTAAMAIPCETVAGASLCEAVAWQAKAGGRLGKHGTRRAEPVGVPARYGLQEA